MSAASSLPPPEYLRQPQVLAIVPISDTTLWRWVKEKRFPAPHKVGPRVTAWRASDVRDWCQRQSA